MFQGRQLRESVSEEVPDEHSCSGRTNRRMLTPRLCSLRLSYGGSASGLPPAEYRWGPDKIATFSCLIGL